ncbi:MAG: hypothetical protein LBC18_13145, partial [Opitutaceae bacterium]|nr:hypothetical protein [Opitutaceae bacterium]
LHRRTAAGDDIYFLFNHAGTPFAAPVDFRAAGRRPELWDALSGKRAPAPFYETHGAHTRIPLSLDANASVFVVFPAAAQSGAGVPQTSKSSPGPDPARPRAPDVPALPDGPSAQSRFGNLRYDGPDAPPAGVTQTSKSAPAPAFPPGAIFLNARYYQPDIAADAAADAGATAGHSAPRAPQSAFHNPQSALEGPWTLEFANKTLGAPDAITLEKLIPWNGHADDAIRHYSGTGIYRKTLRLPPDFPADAPPAVPAAPAAPAPSTAPAVPADAVPAAAAGTAGARRLILDLGQVADIAEVRLNGRPVATLWTPPRRADLTDFLRAGDNLLEIHVTNTWVNRLIGDERIPVPHGYQPKGTSKFTDGRLLELPAWMRAPGDAAAKNPRHTFSTWKHYDADSPLHPAGLLGPVKLAWFREVSADW